MVILIFNRPGQIQGWLYKQCHHWYINRRGVAGAVLQTPLWFIHWLIIKVTDPFPENLQNTINLIPLELGTRVFYRLFTPCHISHVFFWQIGGARRWPSKAHTAYLAIYLDQDVVLESFCCEAWKFLSGLTPGRQKYRISCCFCFYL